MLRWSSCHGKVGAHRIRGDQLASHNAAVNKDDRRSATDAEDPSPEDVEFVSIDPLPYLQRLLAGLPVAERATRADAALRRAIQRGLRDPTFGLQLLVDDPRFDGVLPERLLTLEDFRQPTARERAHRGVLGRTILIVETRETRYIPVFKNGQLVARPLPKPVIEDVLIPILESRTYREHGERRAHQSVEETVAELRRAQTGERPLTTCVMADVRHQPPHWLAFKSRVARDRHKTAKALVAQIERRFRPHPVGRPGRTVGSKNRPKPRPVEHQEVVKVVPRLRALIKKAKQLCREGRDPGRVFDQVVHVLSAPPSSKLIQQQFVQAGPPRSLRTPQEEIVRWIVAKHLGIGLTAVKRLIKRQRPPKRG